MSITAKQIGCPMCARESEPGWIETDNNGPIVRCACNPERPEDVLWKLATLGNPLLRPRK